MRQPIMLFSVLFLVLLEAPCFGETYKWVDEKGVIHFTDDLSKIPERYQPDAEARKTPPETPTSKSSTDKPAAAVLKSATAQEFEVNLVRRHEIWLAEVVLNEKVRRHFIVDTGASFTLINRQTADELGIVVDENTPVIPGTTVSGTIFTPLVTLRSIRVGDALLENVEAVIHTLPGNQEGLLGNSFLNKYRMAIDTLQGKMVLQSMQGSPSPDRPGGYGRDYWVGQFRFYHQILVGLKRQKEKYETQGGAAEITRITKAIQFFENQLGELERKASLAGVPRHWRE